MTISDQLLLGLQAYESIQTDPTSEAVTERGRADPVPADAGLADPEFLPKDSLLLGVATDGLPVLLDLGNPTSGPILVVGGAGAGKTDLLKFLATASSLLADPGDVSFGVLANFPEEWHLVECLPNSLGVWPSFHPSAGEFLAQLVSWGRVLVDSRQAVLLLVDDLEMLTDEDPKFRHEFHQLLRYGPQNRIWPVVTVNPSRLHQPDTWLASFHTRIYAHLSAGERGQASLETGEFDPAGLIPGTQFGLRSVDGWLKFTIPAL